MRQGMIVRRISRRECPWLERDLRPGSVVYKYGGPTYGVIARGIAVSDRPGETPFYEVPLDAVEWAA